MEHDTNQRPSIIDREVLENELRTRLKTEISEEASAVIAHSLWCVFGQICKTAKLGLEAEVKELCQRHEFDGIPTLEPRHFLPTHQHLFDSLEVTEPGYEPGPSVRPRR